MCLGFGEVQEHKCRPGVARARHGRAADQWGLVAEGTRLSPTEAGVSIALEDGGCCPPVDIRLLKWHREFDIDLRWPQSYLVFTVSIEQLYYLWFTYDYF
jgi:hypothetical protein